jgi:hypothetical protein
MCKYSTNFQFLDKISCDCSGGNSEDCYQGTAPEIRIGVGKLCDGLTTEIVAPPSFLLFSDYSIDECVRVEIYWKLARNFRVPQQVSLSYTGRIYYQRNFNEYATLLNDNEAIAGQLIGDGVSIEFAEEMPNGNYLKSKK